ncbi:MAG: GTP-binding protein [Myxococcota bacterium]|nr:GTP-binding protein [Myxococcota bacterium]
MYRTEKIPVTVLCGFLGSGKTTLLRCWQMDEALRDAAFIVHDLSEFGVDVELLSEENSNPQLGRLTDRVAALHGVHARAQLHASVGRVLGEIAKLSPVSPQVLCESTGAARPWPLIDALTQDARFLLRHFIVTVDALNLHRDFENGRVLIGEASVSNDPALQYAAKILAEQLIFASVIILTKIDMVNQAVVDDQIRVLQKLQPYATIALSAQAGLRLSQLEATPAPDYIALKRRAEQFGLTRDKPTAEQVEAIVIRDRRPFHPQRLYDICQNQLGTGIYRTKGFLWLASRPADVLLWQQSGSQISFEATSVWAAEAVHNRYGRLLPSEVELFKKQVESDHPIFGDRRNALTIIGLPHACKIFASAVRSALCTENEVAAWQRGHAFSDPWPKNPKRS